jgi:hypothetical protein
MEQQKSREHRKNMKGIAFLAPILLGPLGGIIILVVLVIIGLISVSFIWQNLLLISLVLGGIGILWQLAKNKQLKSKDFIFFFIVVIFAYGLLNFGGLMAVGIAGNSNDLSIEVTPGEAREFFKDLPTLSAYSSTEDVPTASTFSFTCGAIPGFEALGCRIAPYTYRPLNVKVCNKDPELPLPPTTIIISVDAKGFVVNQKIKMNDIVADDKAVAPGDVFITAGEKSFWFDETVAWMKGEKQILTRGGRYQILYISQALPPCKLEDRASGNCPCVAFGSDSDVDKNNLFVVAAKGAQINTQHTIQVALVEMVPADKFLSWSEALIKGSASWFGSVPLIGNFMDSVSYNAVSTMLVPVNKLTSSYAATQDRTVFAVGFYKIIVAYPYLEILIFIGAVALVGLIVAWRFGALSVIGLPP